jgi:hypothetical protein
MSDDKDLTTLDDVLRDINGKEIHYRNDVNFKPANTTIELTPQHIVEYQKCSQDIVYFAENHVKIMDPNAGRCLVKLYDYQKDILRTMVQERFVVLNTARQVGKTLLVTIYILWISTFQNDKISAILANKENTAKKIYLEFIEMFRNLEIWMKAGTVSVNRKTLDLDNGCRIFCAATSQSSIRGNTITGVLFCDETAFIPNFPEIYASIYPTVTASKTSKVFLTSTPYGLNSWYWIVKNSREGKSEFKLKEVYWYQVPGRDEKWKEQEIRNTSPEQFAQEHDLVFQGSANALIPNDIIKNIDPISPVASELQGDYKIYKLVEEGHQYVISVDPSTGTGKDYSVANVLDVTCHNGAPIEQVAMYRSSMVSQQSLAYIVSKMGKDYNESLVVIENNFGTVLGEILENEIGYGNLFTDTNKQSLQGKAPQVGIIMTKKTKRIGIERFKELMTNALIRLNSEEVVEELSNFVRRTDSWGSSSPDLHDDIVMSLVIFSYFTKTEYYKEFAENDAYGEMVRKNLSEAAGDDYVPMVIKVEDDYNSSLGGDDFIAITPDWFK